MTATYPLARPSAFAANATNPLATLDSDLVNLTDTLNGLGNGSSVLSSVTISTVSITSANITSMQGNVIITGGTAVLASSNVATINTTTIHFDNGTSTTAAVPVGGRVLMTRVAGNWVVYAPDGTTLNTPVTKTQGLQEAISYAANNSFSLIVDGGGGKATIPPLVSNSNIYCTAPITLQPMTGQLIDIRASSIVFASNITGNIGIIFDSCDMVHFRHTGQIVYPGSGTVVDFKPTNPNSENFTGITTSRFEFGAIVPVISPSNYAADSTKGICANLDSTNALIINSTFSFDEFNAGQVGLALTCPAHSIQNNVFLLPSIHTQGAQGINVGFSGGLNTGIHANHFDAQLNTGNATTSVIVYGVGNTFDLQISGNSASVGVNLQTSASGNLFNIAENLATTKVLDNSTAKDNQGYGPGWTQANSLAASGYTTFPTGLIIEWGTALVNANTSLAVSFPLAFPNAALSATVSQVGGLTAGLAAPGYANLTTTTINLNNNQGTTQNISYFVTGH